MAKTDWQEERSSMRILDCASFDSALCSCANVLGVAAEALGEELRGFEYASVPKAERDEFPYEELLPMYVCDSRKAELPSADTTHWFHGTRVRPGTTFRHGLLPLNQQLESIWAFLEELAADWTSTTEWKDFRGNMQGDGARLYGLKTESRIHYGPYAVLVRDVLINPLPFSSHDYLDGPEIVEDICASYTQSFGRLLYQRFHEATRPCIVKFRSSQPRPDAVGAALMYVHRLARGEDMSLYCNTCYSGDGVAIPASDIIDIEWRKDVVG